MLGFRPRMKTPRLTVAAGVLLVSGLGAGGLGCSGPFEYAVPLEEPDPGTVTSVSAAQDDTPECLPEGTEIPEATDGEAVAACCAGLERADAFKGSVLRLDACEPDPTGHAFCIKCGDGRCGIGENTCTCPADCTWP